MAASVLPLFTTQKIHAKTFLIWPIQPKYLGKLRNYKRTGGLSERLDREKSQIQVYGLASEWDFNQF